MTVVQGSISSEIGQHLSREHLLLAAQGNCTFTSSWSSFKETETEGGLKAGRGQRRELLITFNINYVMMHICHIKKENTVLLKATVSCATESREPAGFHPNCYFLLYYRNCRLSLTEVTVVELVWLDPDGGAGAEVDAEADHVVQLKV